MDKWLRQVPIDAGNYIAGFVDGEGSFHVSIRKRNDHRLGWQATLTLNVSQNERTIVAFIKRWIGCGNLQTRKDGVSYYVISNYRAINERVIPFFKRFRFRSEKKKKNFSIFCQIAEMMNRKEHLSEQGFKKLMKLREKLNEDRGRRRKYTVQNVQY